MENLNSIAYFGDELENINDVRSQGYFSEELEIIGANYVNRQLIIALRRESGEGFSFGFEGKWAIMNFCIDIGAYDYSESFKKSDFCSLKGKKVEGFVKEGGYLEPTYIMAISPIYRRDKNYGNNSDDWRIEDVIGEEY